MVPSAPGLIVAFALAAVIALIAVAALAGDDTPDDVATDTDATDPTSGSPKEARPERRRGRTSRPPADRPLLTGSDGSLPQSGLVSRWDTARNVLPVEAHGVPRIREFDLSGSEGPWTSRQDRKR